MRHTQLAELSAITAQRDYRDSIVPSFRALPKEPSVRSIASSTAIGPAVDIFAGSIGFFWPLGLTLGPQGCGGSFGHLRSVHRHGPVSSLPIFGTGGYLGRQRSLFLITSSRIAA